MTDRQPTLRVTLLLARLLAVATFLPSCGSGSPSSAPQAQERDLSTSVSSRTSSGSSRSANENRNALGATATLDETFSGPPAIESRIGEAMLCSRDPVAFDLSAMTPIDSTRPQFIEAWDTVRRHADVPGFVIAYWGTASGPIIEARVGAVYPVAPGLYAFERLLPGTDAENVPMDPTDPFHVMSLFTSREFVTAFGKAKARQGFIVSRISVDGRLDSRCEFLRNVVVEMTLPRTNTHTEFADTTIDMALGALNEDTDRDGIEDSWRVTLTAPMLANLAFSL